MIVCTRTIEFFIMTDFAIYPNLLTQFAILKFVLDMSIELNKNSMYIQTPLRLKQHYRLVLAFRLIFIKNLTVLFQKVSLISEFSSVLLDFEIR